MVITTGFFDGVHLGHRFIIDLLVHIAKTRKEKSLVATFWPHPRTVLQDDARTLRLLNTLEEKQDLLYSLGVDIIEVIPFSKDFSNLSAEEYLEGYVKSRLGSEAMPELKAIYKVLQKNADLKLSGLINLNFPEELP